MSLLWVDKYRPKDLDSLDYHKNLANRLKILVKEGDFPHLLFYGPMGAGKKTRIMCTLRELYGVGIEKLKSETLHFTTPSNKKLEILTISSNYHIELNPADVGIYDRIVIMDVIKNMAQTQQLNANLQKEFKVIVLTDADNLTKDAQHALRRTMEKYINNCRIILCANSISCIIPPILSRCLCIRIPSPTHEEITKILIQTCSKEGLNLPEELAKRIAVKSSRNIRRALLMCETCKVQNYPFKSDQSINEPDWESFIKNNIATKMIKNPSVEILMDIRKSLTTLITSGIPTNIILNVLVKELINNCDLHMATTIAEEACIYDVRLKQGNKAIFHLEAFVARFMYLHRQMMEEIMMIDF